MAGPAVPVVLNVEAPGPPPRHHARFDARHPSQHRRERPARLTIDVVEGRGIWVELDGDLIDGSLTQVETRLARLAQLDFGIVVVGAGRLRAIDDAGSDVLGRFVDRVCDGAGTVVIVDPDGATQRFAERLTRAIVTRDPPAATWWLA